MLNNITGTTVPTSKGEMVVTSLTIEGLIAMFMENKDATEKVFSGDFDLNEIIETCPVFVDTAIQHSLQLEDKEIEAFDSKDKMVLFFSIVEVTAKAISDNSANVGKIAAVAAKVLRSL
jgi:hypothetical protein